MPEVITKEEAVEFAQLAKKMQTVVEDNGKDSATHKSFMEKSAKDFKEFNEKSEELVKSHEALRKTAEEDSEKIKHLEMLYEKGLATPINKDQLKEESFEVLGNMMKGANYKEALLNPDFEAKASRVFADMAKKDYCDDQDNFGVKAMINMVNKYAVKADAGVLRSDIAEQGGFLCPPEVSRELNRLVVEAGPLRNFARIKTTSNKTYTEWIKTGIPRAARKGELRASGKSTSKYAEQQWDPMRMSNTIPMSNDQLMNSAIEMVSELLKDNAEAFAVLESEEYFNGDGVKGSHGWSNDVNVPIYNTKTNVLSMDDLRLAIGQLKRGYDPMFQFNRRTLAELMVLKDSNGRYLWTPPYGDAASGTPATIAGVRYSADFIENDDIDVADGFPILLADMSRFYQIVDRTDITLIRDIYTEAEEAAVKFIMHKYNFGKVKIHEAGLRIKKIA